MDRQGATAVAPLSRSEYLYNSGLAVEVYREARDSGVECQVFDKTGLSDEGLRDVVEAYGPTCALELHFNAEESGKARGTETLVREGSPQCLTLAECVHAALISGLARSSKQDRGVKTLHQGDRGFANVNLITHPMVLVEPAFGSNKDDAKLLMDSERILARALVRGALDFSKKLGNL
jgi:N-acetylmuramoyl-L-alanine amidase